MKFVQFCYKLGLLDQVTKKMTFHLLLQHNQSNMHLKYSGVCFFSSSFCPLFGHPDSHFWRSGFEACHVGLLQRASKQDCEFWYDTSLNFVCLVIFHDICTQVLCLLKVMVGVASPLVGF